PEITLLDSVGAMRALTVSDTTGAFTLSVPDPGSYLLTASRMGFSLVRAEVTVGEKELLDVELEISEEAIPLDPIVVVARRRIRQGTLDEFYDRMARMKQRGSGFFFTLEDIARFERAELPFMLQTAPGVLSSPTGGSDHVIQMMGRRGLCYPAVYLDGLPLAAPGAGSRNSGEDASVGGLYPFGDGGGGAARPRYSTIQTMDLEGVEIYRGRFEQPDGYWTSDCGAIFLWRKRDWGNPFTVQRLLLAGGLTGMAFLLLSLF
ncbi:MAG: TonB-dependent receptor plug domain-containing protein, partial [Gemmatimonadota bacterium]